MSTLIEEKDVSAVNLAVELERAVIQHVLQDDESIYVTEDGWFPFWIRVQENNGYLTFKTYTRFKRAASHLQRLELCNEFNASNYVVTSYVQGDTLYFDCIVNFRDGVLRETFIRTCRQFSKNIEKGLSQVNVDDTFVLRPGKTEPEDEEAP